MKWLILTSWHDGIYRKNYICIINLTLIRHKNDANVRFINKCMNLSSFYALYPFRQKLERVWNIQNPHKQISEIGMNEYMTLHVGKCYIGKQKRQKSMFVHCFCIYENLLLCIALHCIISYFIISYWVTHHILYHIKVNYMVFYGITIQMMFQYCNLPGGSPAWIDFCVKLASVLGSLLLTWFNFNPSMIK